VLGKGTEEKHWTFGSKRTRDPWRRITGRGGGHKVEARKGVKRVSPGENLTLRRVRIGRIVGGKTNDETYLYRTG